MSANLYTLVSESDSEIVQLGAGTLFRKQIVKFGTWAAKGQPGAKMVLNKSWAQSIVDNFKKRVIDRVPVPLTHTDQPEANTGEVVGLDIQDDGLYATLDIREADTANKIKTDLIWDVSVSFSNEFADSKSGKEVGPTLFHVALVNDPYLTGMKPFEALAAGRKAIMLSQSKENENMSVVKNEREFDVIVKYQDGEETKEVTIAAGSEVEVPEEAVEAVTKQVTEAEAPEVKADEAETPAETPETPAETPAETAETPAEETPAEVPEETPEAKLSRENAELRAELAARAGEDAYKTLLTEGKVVPAQRDAFLSLHAAGSSTVNLSNGETKTLSDAFTDFVKAGPKRIEFSEDGKDGGEGEPKTPFDELSDDEKAATVAIGISPERYNEINGGSNNDKKEAN